MVTREPSGAAHFGGPFTPLQKAHSCDRVAVVGAGLAGTACAVALSRAGHQVTVFEAAAGPAQGASGNAVGILHPLVSLDRNRASQWFDLGMRTSLRWLASNPLAQEAAQARLYETCGVLQLANDAEEDLAWQSLPDRLQYSPDWLCYWPATRVRQHLPNAQRGALWCAQGAWVKTAQWVHHCERIAKAQGARFCYGVHLKELPLEDFDHVVVCAAGGAAHLLPEASLMLRSVYGSITTATISPDQSLPFVVCGKGYATPVIDGAMTVGATYQRTEETIADIQVRESLLENIARLDQFAPDLALHLRDRLQHLDPQRLAPGFLHRSSVRSATIDRMPLIGAVADLSTPLSPRVSQLHHVPRNPRVWVLGGLGSRGLAIAPLGAEMITAMIGQAPLPVSPELARAVDPARFALRRHQRSAHAKLMA